MDGTQLMYLIGWILAFGIPGMIAWKLWGKENEKTAKNKKWTGVAIFAIVAAAMLTTPVYYDFFGIKDINFGTGTGGTTPPTGAVEYVTDPIQGDFEFRQAITQAKVSSDLSSYMYIMPISAIADVATFNFWGAGVQPSGFTDSWDTDHMEVGNVIGGTSYYRIFKNTTTLAAGQYYTAYDTATVNKEEKREKSYDPDGIEWFTPKFFDIRPVSEPEILYVAEANGNYNGSAQTFSGMVRAYTNLASLGAPLYETRLYIAAPLSTATTNAFGNSSITWTDIDLSGWTLDSTTNQYYKVIPTPLVRYDAIGQRDVYNFDLRITTNNWAANGIFTFTTQVKIYDRAGVLRSTTSGQWAANNNNFSVKDT